MPEPVYGGVVNVKKKQIMLLNIIRESVLLVINLIKYESKALSKT